MNKQVGPFANPSEQYEYYTLPFCAPKTEIRKNQVAYGTHQTFLSLAFIETNPSI